MKMTATRLIWVAGLVALFVGLVLAGDSAWAANGAYAVDAADVSDLGACKLESWLSAATNTDFSAVANPTCVVDLGRPVELSVLTNRYRADDDKGLGLTPKVKFNIAPTGIGRWGVSFLSAATFDAASGRNQTFLAEVPATYRFSEITRINVIAGWFRDNLANRDYLTYGAGFDWKLSNLWEYTVEAFGFAGRPPRDAPGTVRPRVQTGLRYRPDDAFSVDLIYGHNITGENAHWITVGTTIRFPPPNGPSSRPHD